MDSHEQLPEPRLIDKSENFAVFYYITSTELIRVLRIDCGRDNVYTKIRYKKR